MYLIQQQDLPKLSSRTHESLKSRVESTFHTEHSGLTKLAVEHMGEEAAKGRRSSIIRKSYQAADQIAYSAAQSHVDGSSLAVVVAADIRKSAREVARDKMQETGAAQDAANVRELQERDRKMYSFWGLDEDRPDGPEVQDLILKNAIRIICARMGIPFKDLTDSDMHAEKPLKIQLEEADIKTAITEALSNVADSASRTNTGVDKGHQLDFVLEVDNDGKQTGVLVNTEHGTTHSKKFGGSSS